MTPQVRPSDPPLRADAQRNRDQIIAAARAAFGGRGLDVPMEEIARSAGVGVGTLYRRFPDRNALVRAVALDNTARVLAQARHARDAEATAWAALVRLLREAGDLRLSVQLAMLSTDTEAMVLGDPELRTLRVELIDTLDEVVRAAQEEGSLRRDVGTGDIAALVSMLINDVRKHPRWMLDRASERTLAIALDGLRARGGTPLPGAPITRADLAI